MANRPQTGRQCRLDLPRQRPEEAGRANESPLSARRFATHSQRRRHPEPYRAAAGLPESPPPTAVLTIALYRSASALAFSESSMLTMMW